MNRDGDDVGLTSSFRMAFLVLVAMVGVFAQGKGAEKPRTAYRDQREIFPAIVERMRA